MKAKSVADVQIGLSDEEIVAIQEGADFGLSQKLTLRSPNMREAIDQSFLRSAVGKPDFMTLEEVHSVSTKEQ